MFDFKRETNYSPEVLNEACRLMETKVNEKKVVLVVPNKAAIKAYSNGKVLIEKLTDRSFNIIGPSIDSYKKKLEKKEGLSAVINGISGKMTREDRKNYFFGHIKGFIEIVSMGMPRDKERMSSQQIAMNNMTFEDDRYSVCGWETTLGKGDIGGSKKVEIDLVVVHPNKREMLLIEYKCKGESMIKGKQNISEHGKDYMQILHSANMSKIRDELLNAYNVYRKIKKMPELEKSTYNEYKVKIGFLFVDKILKDGIVVSEITDSDYKKGMELLNKRFKYLEDDIVYIRAARPEEVKFDEWKIVRDSGLETTIQ